MILVDEYQTKTPECLPNTYGWKKKYNWYSEGNIYVYHATGIIFIFHRIYLHTGETPVGKKTFEKFACEYGITIEHINGDNRIFTSWEFQNIVTQKGKPIVLMGRVCTTIMLL